MYIYNPKYFRRGMTNYAVPLFYTPSGHGSALPLVLSHEHHRGKGIVPVVSYANMAGRRTYS